MKKLFLALALMGCMGSHAPLQASQPVPDAAGYIVKVGDEAPDFEMTLTDGSKVKLSDLKGRKVAHTAPSSNSGHMAPMALFPKEGLAPEKDYKILFSGKHDQSVMGVNSGDYEAAAVASDVFHRMATRGQVKESDFRIIYTSPKFPTSSFAYAHDLEPTFRDKMLKCFYDYRFTPEMQKAFDGADRFFPITYQKDFAIVRDVAEAGGEKFNRAAYEREAAKSKK